MSKELKELYVKCWTDEDFKKRLMAEPIAVLKEFGLEPAEGITNVNVVENTATTITFVLPAKPANATVASSELISEATRIEAVVQLPLTIKTVP